MTTANELRTRVTESLVSFGADPDQITDEATLESLDIDSLDVAELAEMLREEYEISIDARDFASCETVADAFAVIERRAGL